jgi:glycogen debranching enzyme
VPIFAGVAAARIAHDLATRWQAPWPIPTVPLGDARFEPRRYWRGPTWININWLVITGLRDNGFADAAAHLAERTLELVARSGFREYYHPETGEGLGADEFSWTAALVLDLL